MLKLKKLQILGFKSFCDRTEMKFHGDGIAAIVGPNGCGKSNIADAIAWVLGEQSAKSLRGTRMEDVIFIGTRDRKPTGMAEVSLTFIDPSVYDGMALSEPEIDIKDELDDWDEAAVRASAAEKTDEAVAEVQPLGAEEANPEATADQAAPASATPAEAPETAGTAKEVVLKIRRRKFKPQHFQAGEIVITRRLFRSGESEYLLNGKLCRLRDIQDLFMGTGLGPESYAIIEQGRIGQILSSKPHDRRAIIEEAAGVTKFKQRKRLAEARLEQSKLNLSRVNDIFEEVTRQMNSLKRQAAKAERYARLRDELKEKLRLVLASKFALLEAEQQRSAQQISELSAQMHAGSERLALAETEQAQKSQQAADFDAEVRQCSERRNSITLELDRAAGRQQTNEERCAELTSRIEANNAELGKSREQLRQLQEELNANRAFASRAGGEVAAAQAELQNHQQQVQMLSASAARLEEEQESRRRGILAAVASASEVRNQIAKSEEQVASLEREAARLQQEMSHSVAQTEPLAASRTQVATEYQSIANHVANLAAQIVSTRRLLDQKRMEEEQSKRQADGLRAEYASALGRKGSLEALIAEHGYSTESVKRLFHSGHAQKSFTPAGVLADFLEVEDRYESVVEDFLRDELNYVVVKSWDAADEGLRLLRGDADGRATFLVHPEDAQARFSFLVDERNRPAPRRDAVVPLKNCIRVLNGFGKSLEVILPKLGNGYIAPDAATARDMALENPEAFFLSPSGETFHNVTVTGGRQRSEGPLAVKRELRELTRALDELERELRAAESRIAALGREIAELVKVAETLEAEKREAERRLLSSEHAVQQFDSELQRLNERVHICRSEIARLERERQAGLAEIGNRRAAEQQYESRRVALEAEFTTSQAALADLREQRERASLMTAEASSKLAALEERLRGAASVLERTEAMVAEASARILSLEQQISGSKVEIAQRTSENQQLALAQQTLQTERVTIEQLSQEAATASEELRSSVQAIGSELRNLRQELDALRDRRGELAATAAKLQSDAEHLAESCLNELNVTREDLVNDRAIPRLDSEALAAEDAIQREMRTRLEAMGPVNMMALEEYKEVVERHAFLEKQRQDLLESIENTQASIRELDEVTKVKFEEAFNRINENFQFTFRKLFGGGQAFMRLTDQENSAESGIDVIASPPGKKLQNVLLLSGGEKALTALSLLVAIFQYQPSPFCLLDEVDAPLDEANVGRFTEMVRELSGTTQFILITHNKRTMGVAPVMYGVTMQEPGVSKLVSVRFGENTQAATA